MKTRHNYLLTSVAVFDKPDEGSAEDKRKAAVEAERAKVQVTKVDIEEDKDDEGEKKEIEAKDDDKKDEDEQKDESGDEEKEEKDDKDEDDKEDDKDEIKAAEKLARLEKKLARESIRRREAEKREKDALKRLEAKPDKALTEEDVKEKVNRELTNIQYNSVVEKLVDDAQKHLKFDNKQMDSLIAEAQDSTGEPVPADVVLALDDVGNGAIVLAYLLKNPDIAEDIYKLKGKYKLGVELERLSVKLATPKLKKISQVPDPPEPLGGKSAGGDRLAVLASKKNLTSDEMNEYVQARNADIAQKRANGRINLK